MALGDERTNEYWRKVMQRGKKKKVSLSKPWMFVIGFLLGGIAYYLLKHFMYYLNN